MKRIALFVLSIAATLHIMAADQIVVGAAQTDRYLPILQNHRVALFSNHTGLVGKRHTLDILLGEGIKVTAIFSPEHGFRGTAGAGDHVASSIDEKTGVPILSLYDGKSYKPSTESMEQFDILVVDIQDVGLRFYTYYITMVRLMEACAEHHKQVVVFDRPNPNGSYIDGPILDMKKYKSGVGYLPIPVVHGLTLGELALMVNGEGWLPNNLRCELTVIPCQGYTHQSIYNLPVAPSPNLQKMLAIYLYPSLCLFEATNVSLGRGTDKPFLQYGHPDLKPYYEYSFTPVSCPAAPKPTQQDQLCYGIDLSEMDEMEARKHQFDLSFVIDCYTKIVGNDPNATPEQKNAFFTSFFEKLVGVSYIREMILQGASAKQIAERWQPDVEHFRIQRKPYLLYAE